MSLRDRLIPNFLGLFLFFTLLSLSYGVLWGLYQVRVNLYLPLFLGLSLGCLLIFFLEKFFPEKLDWKVNRKELIPHTLYYFSGSIAFKILLDPFVLNPPIEFKPFSFPHFLGAFLHFEFSGFLFHYFSHRLKPLWKWHKIHHNTPKLNFMANNVAHFLSVLMAALFTVAPMLWIQLDIRIILFIIYLAGMFNFFSHSNIKAKLGFFEFLLVSPNFHRWHHEVNSQFRINYGIITPLFDILFQTARFLKESPAKIGLKDDPYFPSWVHFFKVHSPRFFLKKIRPQGPKLK